MRRSRAARAAGAGGAPALGTRRGEREPAAAAPTVGRRRRRRRRDRRPASGVSLRDLEERFAGRALAWAGGLALVAAAIFFLSLAFSRGWISEPMRVADRARRGGRGAGPWRRVPATAGTPLMGNVITARGAGRRCRSASCAATRLYGLIPPEVGLAGALVVAIAAAAIAIRFDAREVAAFGLIAALIAPPLVGAPPTHADAGVRRGDPGRHDGDRTVPILAAAARRRVRARRAAAGRVAARRPEPAAEALVVLGGFWLVNVVAAAGEEIRIRRDDLRAATRDARRRQRRVPASGAASSCSTATSRRCAARSTLVAALAHLAVGGWMLGAQGLEHLFGNLVAGTGVALLALAALVQLGASVVPIAWAAEAVALTWLAVRRRHRWSALAAAVLGGLAIAHLVVVEYPVRLLDDVPATATPRRRRRHAVAGRRASSRSRSRRRSSRSAGSGRPCSGSPSWSSPGPHRSTRGRRRADRRVGRAPADRRDRSTPWLVTDPAGREARRARPGPASAVTPATAAGAVAWSIAALYALAGPAVARDLWGTFHPAQSAVHGSFAPLVGGRCWSARPLAARDLDAARHGPPPGDRGRDRRGRRRRAGRGATRTASSVAAGSASPRWRVLVPAADERAGSAFDGARRRRWWLGAVIVAFAIVAPPQRLVVVDAAEAAGRAARRCGSLAFAAIALGLLAAPPPRAAAPMGDLARSSARAACTFVYAVSVAIVAVFQGDGRRARPRPRSWPSRRRSR